MSEHLGDWLPPLPPGWALKPFFCVFTERKQPNNELQVDTVLSLSYGRIVERDVESNFGLLPASFETYNIVEPQDIVMRLTDLQNDQRSLRTGQVEQRGIITAAYVTVTPTAGVHPRFAHYLLHGYDLAKLFYRMGGGLRQSMKFDDLKRMPVVLPPPSEQACIANFLDEKTARIDALIAEKGRLLSSLSQLRKSVVHAIVTGTYSAPGVETGSRYFPLMAQGWSLTRVKHIADSLDGKRVPLNSEERAERQGCYPYYGASGQIDNIDDYIFDEPLVLVGEDGANLLNRATPLAFVAEGKYWVNNHAHILRPRDGRVRLWARVIDSLDITDWVSGSAQPKLTIDALMNLPVPKIPDNVRDDLESKLNDEESRIDALVSHTEEHIARLREYRSSLISAAVTGQLAIESVELA